MGDELYGDLANIGESLVVQQVRPEALRSMRKEHCIDGTAALGLQLQEKVEQLEKENESLRAEVAELTEQVRRGGSGWAVRALLCTSRGLSLIWIVAGCFPLR